MKLRPLALSLLFLTVAAFVPAAEPALTPIFNGQDLTGWKSSGSNLFWRVAEGVLIGENDEKRTGNMLWSEREYGDFVLEFEVRWIGEIDSGIEMRQPNVQLQLGISRSLKRDMTGSFYVGKPGYPEAGQAKDAPNFCTPRASGTPSASKPRARRSPRGSTASRPRTIRTRNLPALHLSASKFIPA